MKRRLILYIALPTVLLIAIGYILPEKIVIPVEGATKNDWNHKAFWHENWKKSKVHKGIDIFAKKGTPVLSSTKGVVIYKGKFGIGGNVIFIIGAKWKIYYYAHLAKDVVSFGKFVNASQTIGLVGSSGNAQEPQLHFEIMTLMPYLWRWGNSTQGWKKIFYLNPSEILSSINT
jgi:murein DD-endopeptidase MepM/ murein hydrolase activator NlpD